MIFGLSMPANCRRRQKQRRGKPPWEFSTPLPAHLQRTPPIRPANTSATSGYRARLSFTGGFNTATNAVQGGTQDALAALLAGYTNASGGLQGGFNAANAPLGQGINQARTDIAGGFANAQGALGAGMQGGLNAINAGYANAGGALTGGFNAARGDVNAGFPAPRSAKSIRGRRGRSAIWIGRGRPDPLAAIGQKYGAGGTTYLDTLGVNGPEGQARARAAFLAGPAYTHNFDQGLQAITGAAMPAACWRRVMPIVTPRCLGRAWPPMNTTPGFRKPCRHDQP